MCKEISEMNIVVIPARGGSKRIPLKNIKPFYGKPMIAWSIEAAKACGLFEHIIVSTDDADIARIAVQYGAEVPFERPAELSDDFTGTGAVVKHALEWCIANIGPVDFVCTLYATAPFIKPQDIINGFELLKGGDCQMTFTVTSFSFPIQRAVKIASNGSVSMFQPENFFARSQDLESAYHDAGQLYWATTKAVLQDLSAFSEVSKAQILPRYKVQDIDTQEDWVRAELMYKAWHS
jgi:pseudaminic acid cytidylyltransferase